jgi:hypothetical protein
MRAEVATLATFASRFWYGPHRAYAVSCFGVANGANVANHPGPDWQAAALPREDGLAPLSVVCPSCAERLALEARRLRDAERRLEGAA